MVARLMWMSRAVAPDLVGRRPAYLFDNGFRSSKVCADYKDSMVSTIVRTAAAYREVRPTQEDFGCKVPGPMVCPSPCLFLNLRESAQICGQTPSTEMEVSADERRFP